MVKKKMRWRWTWSWSDLGHFSLHLCSLRKIFFLWKSWNLFMLNWDSGPFSSSESRTPVNAFVRRLTRHMRELIIDSGQRQRRDREGKKNSKITFDFFSGTWTRFLQIEYRRWYLQKTRSFFISIIFLIFNIFFSLLAGFCFFRYRPSRVFEAGKDEDKWYWKIKVLKKINKFSLMNSIYHVEMS